MNKVFLLLSLLLLLGCSEKIVPTAHQISNFSCKGAEEGAIVELPFPLDHWGSVRCMDFGHVIVNFVHGQFHSVWILAQVPEDDSLAEDSSAFFSRISFQELGEEQARRAKHMIINNRIVEVRDEARVFRLQVWNNTGKTRALLFVENIDHPIQWDVACYDDCTTPLWLTLTGDHEQILAPIVVLMPILAEDGQSIEDRLVVVSKLGRLNGCEISGKIVVSETETGSQIYTVPCDDSLIKFECNFDRSTRLDPVTGIPYNEDRELQRSEPTCWQI